MSSGVTTSLSELLAGPATGGDPRPDVALARRAVAGSWVVFAVVAVAFGVLGATETAIPLRYRALAYLALMGTVSLYHGGFEHVENLRGRGSRSGRGTSSRTSRSWRRRSGCSSCGRSSASGWR
ncbi:hypothetical protein ACFQRB_18715 [Halobaculum litoreum]|uniref:Uncharacterized protein n=1 Tax=Halobaculum litoreum TaxID=3031998 RepID=A0ABD5XS45_9EURY